MASMRAPLHQHIGRAWAETLAVGGLAMIFASVVTFDRTTPMPGLPAILPTLGAALVLGFATRGTMVARLLSLKPIVGVGLISYSAYLWHQPLFAFVRIRAIDKPEPVVLGVAALASVGLAYFSWRYVEAPFRDPRRIGRRAIFALALIGSTLFLVIGMLGHVLNGIPARLDPSTRALAASTAPSPKRELCDTRGAGFVDPSKACVYFHPNTTWATLGDSQTIELAYALAERLAKRQEGLIHLSFAGCPPALTIDVKVAGCAEWLNRSLDRLVRDPAVQNVLVGFRYSLYMFGDQLESYPRVPNAGFRIGDRSVEGRVPAHGVSPQPGQS